MTVKVDNQTWNKYGDASLTGAARGLMGLPLEHPFDSVKTYWQANPKIPSATQVVRLIYEKKGIAGFYAGALPNGTRMVLKQTYRFPMMLQFPQFYSRHLPESVKKTVPLAEEALTGLSIASLESGLITPLERLKVIIMTSEKQKRNILKFIRDNRAHLLEESYRGFKACYLRQIITWVTFTVADAFFKSKARKYTNKKENEMLAFVPLMGVGLLVGAVNTAAVMPFDFVKTQLQKKEPLHNGIRMTMSHFLKQGGFSVLYTGWRVKMVQYMLQSAYTVTLLDRLKLKWKTDQK